MAYSIRVEWDDVPHLSEKAKAEMLAAYRPHERDARSKGLPILGSGVIYPVSWDEVSVKPFAIPRYWRRAYALDVGWKRTAALWGAEDPADGTIYCYTEHYRGQAEPSVHAEAIKARGEWIKGAIDPAARGRSQKDGEQLIEVYRALGLKLTPAINEVEAGLYEVWQRLSAGRLKFFSTLQNLPKEYRLYRRDEKGKVIKVDDHLMDDVRYLVMTWDKIASIQAPEAMIPAASTISDADAGY